MATTAPLPAPSGIASQTRRLRIASLVQRQGALIALLLTFTYGWVRHGDDGFIGAFNLTQFLRFNSMIALIALGMTFVIMTGGIDLSVSSVVVIGSVVAANMSGHGPWIAMLAAVGVGAAVGLLNGGVIAFFKVQPFIVTLATLLAGRGVALILADTQVASLAPEAFTNGFIQIASRDLFDVAIPLGFETVRFTVSLPFFLVLVGYVLGSFLLNFSRFGRHVLAVGGNDEAARLAGVPVERTIISVYVISGCLAGLAGVILAANTFAGNPNEAVGWELSAIAAVVVGGTLLTGGLGSVWSTFIGVLLLGLILNLLAFENLGNPYWQQVIRGSFLLVVVVLQAQLVGFRRK